MNNVSSKFWDFEKTFDLPHPLYEVANRSVWWGMDCPNWSGKEIFGPFFVPPSSNMLCHLKIPRFSKVPNFTTPCWGDAVEFKNFETWGIFKHSTAIVDITTPIAGVISVPRSADSCRIFEYSQKQRNVACELLTFFKKHSTDKPIRNLKKLEWMFRN